MTKEPDYTKLAEEFRGFPISAMTWPESHGGNWILWVANNAPAILSALRIAAKAKETEKAARDVGPVYIAVERALDECSAWIARPNAECTRHVAFAASVAASQYFGEATDQAVEAAVAAEREALVALAKRAADSVTLSLGD